MRQLVTSSLVLVLLAASPSLARAQDASAPAARALIDASAARAPGPALARATAPDAGLRLLDAAASLPTPPPAGTAPTGTLPAGHPSVGGTQQPQPTAGGLAMFRPPPDTSDEDPSLPPGTIRVELRDPHDAPIPNHLVELGIIQQSVAKGESRKHLSNSTDGDGATTFAQLETGSGQAYRVSTHEGTAAFAARPFQLSPQRGMHIVLHVYPPTSDFARGAIILSRGIVFMELKDDRVQLQQRIDIRNGSPVAWVPNNVILRLPDDFTALNNVQQMSDIGVDAMPKEGAKLHGTFGPGENSVFFSWQVPYSGDADVSIEIGTPPNLGAMVVRAAASPGMQLEVDGFPAATSQLNEEGQRELVTGRQLQQGDSPMRSIHIALHGLPTPGPSRLIATLLAGLGVAAGIYVGVGRTRDRRSVKTQRRDRSRVLLEIEQLEKARASGDIGPKTYERARRELVDDLAQLLAQEKS